MFSGKELPNISFKTSDISMHIDFYFFLMLAITWLVLLSKLLSIQTHFFTIHLLFFQCIHHQITIYNFFTVFIFFLNGEMWAYTFILSFSLNVLLTILSYLLTIIIYYLDNNRVLNLFVWPSSPKTWRHKFLDIALPKIRKFLMLAKLHIITIFSTLSHELLFAFWKTTTTNTISVWGDRIQTVFPLSPF